ncbi:hypothetical protein A5881_002245 [Enterococcus termitis]|nr:hypothetical protein A5881_001435 [Enterococcus termitis]
MNVTRKLLIKSASLVFTLLIGLFFTMTANADENTTVYGPIKASDMYNDPTLDGWVDATREFTSGGLSSSIIDNTNKIVVSEYPKREAYISNSLYGGGRAKGASAITLLNMLSMRRIDLPYIAFYPVSTTSSGLSSYNRAELGRDHNVNNAYSKDSVSLGLVTAINRDLNTLEEISTEAPAGGNIIKDDTFKVYKKDLSWIGNSKNSASMYIYQAKIHGQYPIEIKMTYLPNEASGMVRVMYDITNLGTEPIPDFMLGFNYYLAAAENSYVNNNYTALKRAGVSYLGGNQGVYTTAHNDTFRGEIYPNINQDGAANWVAWAEPNTAAASKRDLSMFMKGFTDPTNIDSTGDELGGQLPKTSISSATDTTLPIISMKWTPKTLEVGETRRHTWGFAPEVKTLAPRLMVEDSQLEYEPAVGNENNAFVNLNWRNYNDDDTTTLYYRFSEDEAWIKEELTQYPNSNLVGTNMSHTLGLKLAPDKDYNVELKLTGTPKGEDSTIIPVHFKFKVPDPKIESKAIVKEGAKEVTDLYPGGDFSYEYSLKMTQLYSTYTNPEFTLPLNTKLINQTSIKNIKLTKVGGETVAGSFSVADGKIKVKLENSITMDDQLKLTFDATIIDDEGLVGQTLTLQPEITGFVGALADNRAYAIPKEEISSLTLPIKEGMADVEIRFVDETGVTKLHEPIILSKKIGTTIDLTKEQAVLDAIQAVEDKRYELDVDKKPAGETAVPVEKGNAGYTYPFKGVLMFKSTPSTINFGVQRPSVTQTINTDDVKYDMPFVVWDNRQTKKTWRLKASLEKPLTSTDGKNSLPYAIRYKKSKDTVPVPLSEESLAVLSQQHEAQVTEYDVSKGWENKETGLELNVFKNQIASKLGEYSTTVVWELEDVPF